MRQTGAPRGSPWAFGLFYIMSGLLSSWGSLPRTTYYYTIGHRPVVIARRHGSRVGVGHSEARWHGILALWIHAAFCLKAGTSISALV